MKNKLNLLGLLAVIGCVSALQAVEVSPEQAQTAVRNWVRRSPRRMTAVFSAGEARRPKTFRNKEGKSLYHLVEMEEGGFVVTSGDTELPPVIAFSANGTLDLSDTDNPLVAILEKDLTYRNSLLGRPKAVLASAQASTNAVPSSGTSFENEWASLLAEPLPSQQSGGTISPQTSTSSLSDVRVEPIVQSKWGQSRWNGYNTFNYYTPNNYVCGCVATAFAQIMRYWQQPTGSISAGTYYCWVDEEKVAKTMKGGSYSWNSMPLTSSSCSTETQRQAIGKLLYDIGVASQMGWSSSGSGTMGCVAAQALRNRFGYASAHSYCNGDSGSLSTNLAGNEAFRNAILASLDAGMPVAIGIHGTGGHEVVVDGYGYNGGSIIYCHINCGWNGSEDAWYNLIGEGVTSHAYTTMSEVAYNIHPSQNGDVISGRVLTSSGTPVSGATVTLTSASGTQRTTTTNAKGIYAFRAAASATYTVVASSGNATSASQSVTLPLAYDTEWTITQNQGGYVYHTTPSSPYPNGKLGNKWGVNLTLSSSTPEPSTIPLPTALDNTSLRFTTGGSASWSGQAAQTHDGIDAARSGGISHSQQTWLQTTVTGPGTLSFYWYVSCEGSASSSNWDYLMVSIDGEEKARICGTGNSWTRLSYSIPSGTHTIRWLYNKDGSVSVGDDAGFVDQVVWTPSSESGDAYDPGDDTPSGGTTITPSSSRATHAGHTLSATDSYDFFKVYLAAGNRYVFETTGSMDTYGELFNSTVADSLSRVASNDDGGENYNFKLEYAPVSSGTYYLRVRGYSVGSAGSYSLVYQRIPGDSWDPGDDTASGGTWLTPSTTAQTHGPHQLSADDLYDFFCVSMRAGRTYVFESTGSYDMYGELFNSTSAEEAFRVASNDDGGSNGNFKLEYKPTVSQTYYLRVRRYSLGAEGSYSLTYSFYGPANDQFENATELSGSYGEAAGSNIGASYQSDEPLAAYRTSARNTVWWRWTAPSTGTFRFSTEGTAFDTVMGIYSGSSVSALAVRAENDDTASARTSVCSFTAISGVTYYIAVAGYNEAEGAIKLNWRPMPTVLVKLNANGGKITGVAWKPVGKGKAVGSLKTPKRNGYAFTGWYTKKSGGTKVSSKTKVSKTVTYYAHWKVKKYTITLKKTGKGTVSGGGTMAYKTKITLKAKPASGYVFLGWYRDNALVSDRATWSITVPMINITYTAKFVKTSAVAAANDTSVTTDSGTSISAETLPPFAIGSFNGWSLAADENGASIPMRKVTVTVTSAGKISAAVGSVKFSGEWSFVDSTGANAQDGARAVTLRAVRTVGSGPDAQVLTDILSLVFDPAADWTENQLTGTFATYKGCVSAEEAEGLAPMNDDTVISAQRNPFGDNEEAKALAADLAARGVQQCTDADGLVWDVKVSETGVAMIARVATGSEGKGTTLSASAVLAVEKNEDGKCRAVARFLVSGTVLEMGW